MTAIGSVKSYLVDTLLPSLASSATVYYGFPTDAIVGDVITVMDGRAEYDQPVYSTQRPIEEDSTLTISIISYRGGQESTTQRTATEAALDIALAIRNHFKAAPNETLGGAVRTSKIISADLIEDGEDTDPEMMAVGRQAQVDLLLSFQARS